MNIKVSNITNKKNITIAFDVEDYNYLDKLKQDMGMKSFTQTFLFILNFYRDNHETIKELEEQEEAVDEQLENVRKIIENIQDKMVEKSELDYVKTNIDLLNNQVSTVMNIVESLVESRIEEGDAALKENSSIKSLLKAQKKLKE